MPLIEQAIALERISTVSRGISEVLRVLVGCEPHLSNRTFEKRLLRQKVEEIGKRDRNAQTTKNGENEGRSWRESFALVKEW